MRDKYFFLNYLSFESLNLTQMCYSISLGCAAHGATQKHTIMSASAHAGYIISYLYREMHELLPDAKFVLLRENPELILKHLLYGKYANAYTDQIIYDFAVYYGINLTSLNLQTVSESVLKYYADVERHFGENLITIDLPEHENSVLTFIRSPKFLTFYKQLGRCFHATHAEITQESALRYKNNMVDLFAPQGATNFPKRYPVDNIMGMDIAVGGVASNILTLQNSLTAE